LVSIFHILPSFGLLNQVIFDTLKRVTVVRYIEASTHLVNFGWRD
jgi:hypothetical protein